MRSIVVAVLALGCATTPPAPPAPAPPPPVQPAVPSEDPKMPAGYVEVTVLQVVQQDDEGAAVLLLDESTSTVLPIFIGGTEATSIALRSRGIMPARPLTHDLLDSIIRKLRGSLVKVQVDKLEDKIFHGSVFVRIASEKRIVRVDARPSDAIALAIGNRLPIYIARKVLDEAGVPKDEILRQIAPPATGPTI
jgi:uncharacterized protein